MCVTAEVCTWNVGKPRCSMHNTYISNYNQRNSPHEVFRDYYQSSAAERWSRHTVGTGEDDKLPRSAHKHTHTHISQKAPKLTLNHWTLRSYNERNEFISRYLHNDVTSNPHFVVLCVFCEARGGAVCWGWKVAGSNFLWHNPSRPRYGPEVETASNRNEYPEYFLRGKCGRCLELTTLLPSCDDCLEIWEPQPTGTLRPVPACNDVAVPSPVCSVLYGLVYCFSPRI
jgi:hypothetical protein